MEPTDLSDGPVYRPEPPKRKPRLYSLFEIERLPNGRRRYHRISISAFPQAQAVRVYQSALLAPFLSGSTLRERCLRPIKQPRA